MNEQFEKSVGFADTYKTFVNQDLCAEYKSVAVLFSKNMARVHSLGYLTLNINFWTANLTSGIVQAMMRLGRLYAGQKIDDEVRQLANRGLSIYNAQWNQLTDQQKTNKS